MFDSVLGKTTVKSRTGAGTTVSVLLHIGVLAAAVWISNRPPEEKKADKDVVFFAAPPPPPPPPPPPKSSSKKTTPKTEHKIKKPDTIIQPKEVPIEKPPEAEPEPEEEEDNGGVEGGVEGGVKGGVVGGVIGGVIGGTLGGQLGSEVLPFGEGMTRPRQTEGRPPQYSREALEAHIEGLMLVKCVITTEGKLENCRIVKPLPHMERPVLDALAASRWTPVTYQGKPVSVEYVIPVRLVLPNR